MEPAVLLNTAKALLREAQRELDRPRADNVHWDCAVGYPHFMDEYNRLAQFTIRLYGQEAEEYLPLFDLSSRAKNPFDVPGPAWRGYLQKATNRIAALTAFLQSKVSAPDRGADSLYDLIGMNLRAAMFEPPSREVQVQNALEVIFRARALNFRREGVTIPYSTRTFIPDFTFEDMDLALEVKLCKAGATESRLIEEINADIPAYQTRFSRVFFVVFDLGVIRDVERFKSGIEGNPDVRVLVIKM